MNIKKIIKKILKLQNDDIIKYLDSPQENLIFSNVNIEVRNSSPNKKRLKIGCDSSVNCSMIFETEEGYISIGNRVFMGGGHLFVVPQLKLMIMFRLHGIACSMTIMHIVLIIKREEKILMFFLKM